MAALGRTITLHLVDGTPSGIMKAEDADWIGKITAANWTSLADLASDGDIKRPGVYILIGPDKEGRHTDAIYIGEGENVWERLNRQEVDKKEDEFERVIIINRQNDGWNKGHVRYLEQRLLKMIRDAGRTTIKNKNMLSDPIPMSSIEQKNMEKFLETVQIILPVLGVTATLPPPVDIPKASKFTCTTQARGTNVKADAEAQIIDSEFVVLKNSTALLRNEGNIYMTSLKDSLVRSGALIADGQLYRFTQNVTFKSPTAAAGVITGNSINGRLAWKLGSQTYDEWEQARISERENQ